MGAFVVFAWCLRLEAWCCFHTSRFMHDAPLFDYVNHFYVSLIHETFHQASEVRKELLFHIWFIFHCLDVIH